MSEYVEGFEEGVIEGFAVGEGGSPPPAAAKAFGFTVRRGKRAYRERLKNIEQIVRKHGRRR